LPYQFFEDWLVEAWIAEGIGQVPPGQPTTGIAELSWGTVDFAGRVFHTREFYDAGADERLGWAFAVQGPEYLEVEELYVRPQYRRQGYGTRLLQSLKRLSTEAALPLRFFIPFADSKPENLAVVERLLSKERYYLFPSGLRWSPLVALHPVVAPTLALKLPSPPALCSPRSRLLVGEPVLPANGEIAVGQPDRTLPVSESTGLLKPPDVGPAADSFRRGWEEAQSDNTLPVDRLWEGIDVE
jgi:GNAT superfamily N-acetyltransferase